MSMDFSEFKRRIGAEPRSADPDLLRARDSAPEFSAEADRASAFESKLEQAVNVSMPAGLLDELQQISQQPADEAPAKKRWMPMALAASLLIAVGAAGISWQQNRSWDSVGDYLAEHYAYDGHALENQAGSAADGDLQQMLSEFNVEALPQLADIVSVIKYCPTPDGKGVHMVVNTETGPVTLIYMPNTEVTDHDYLEMKDVEAVLVSLPSGSAAIMGQGIREDRELLALVQNSIVTVPKS